MTQIWNGDKNPGIIQPAEAPIAGLALDAADLPWPAFHHTYHLKNVSISAEGGKGALQLSRLRKGVFRINSVLQDSGDESVKLGLVSRALEKDGEEKEVAPGAELDAREKPFALSLNVSGGGDGKSGTLSVTGKITVEGILLAVGDEA